MGQNINKLLKIFNHHGNYERIKFYSSLTLRNLNTTKNNNYKVADLGSGYSFFLAFLRYSLKNSDLYMVNFTDEPLDKIYETLFEVNQDLILDHFKHTSNDMEMANELIDRFSNLYFKGDTSFRGPRNNRPNTVKDRRKDFNNT